VRHVCGYPDEPEESVLRYTVSRIKLPGR